MDPNTNLNEFLDEAVKAIDEADALGARIGALRKERDEAESDLNAVRKRQADQIDAAYKKRRSEIDKTYDTEIGKYEKQLAVARNRRKKAREQGVRERIEDETADLRAAVKAINARTKAAFKAEGVPAYCNSKLFGALYLPNSPEDCGIIIIVLALIFFVIPYGLYKLFFNGSKAALIIIYVLDVILFVGIYILIYKNTLAVHNQVIRQAKVNRHGIEQNKKKIRSTVLRIKEDTNESYYDLARYDDEIAHIRQQLADVTVKKNDAVSTFESVTKNIISDEIVEANKTALDGAGQKLARVTEDLGTTEAARAKIAAEMNSKYEAYLGREFMTRTRICRLKDIINHGTATSIGEAIEEYNRQYDI